jgi:hypothetical protein
MIYCLVNHHIICHLVFVLISTETVMMRLLLIIPPAAEFALLSSSRYDMSVEGIHRELSAVYGPTVMTEGTVRQWCRMYKDGRRAKWSAICSE